MNSNLSPRQFIRFEAKKLLFNTALSLPLPDPAYPCQISSFQEQSLRVTDGEYSISCKLSTQAQQELLSFLAYNQELTQIEGLRIVLQEASMQFTLKSNGESSKGGAKLVPRIRLTAKGIQIPQGQKEQASLKEVRNLEEDQEVATLMRFKMNQLQKDAVNSQLQKEPYILPLIGKIEAAGSTTSKALTTSSTRHTCLESPLLAHIQAPARGFVDLTDDDLAEGDELSGSKTRHLTFKEVIDEFGRRNTAKQREEADFLELLQMGQANEEEEEEEVPEVEEEVVAENELMDAMEIEELPSEPSVQVAPSKPVEDVLGGFGMNVSQNQNDLRQHRLQTLANPSYGSHPSQGDLLDIMDKTAQNSRGAQALGRKQDVPTEVIQARNQAALQANRQHQLEVSPIPVESKFQQSKKAPLNEVEDEGMEIQFSKEDYDRWLARMTERKFNHYIAWFNVNIKQVNSQPPSPPPQVEPDYRISAPIIAQPEEPDSGILQRLKQTAHRRNPVPSAPAAPPKNEPSVIKIENQRNLQGYRVTQASDEVVPQISSIAESAFNQQAKKRTREEFEAPAPRVLPEVGVRAYKKLKANDGAPVQQQQRSPNGALKMNNNFL